MKTHHFYDSPTALFCECDTLAQSKTISGRPSGIAAEFCGGPFRPHWPHFYENVLILPQSHDPVLRIRRAGAVKTTIIDVKGQTTMKRKRPFRSHRPSFYEQRHTHIFYCFFFFHSVLIVCACAVEIHIDEEKKMHLPMPAGPFFKHLWCETWIFGSGSAVYAWAQWGGGMYRRYRG